MKYKLLLLLSLLFAATIQAQVVNIPDASFKNYLINYSLGDPIDTNQDGEIQVSEAAALTYLNIDASNSNIASLEGIEAFINLISLQISCNVTNIDLTSNMNLEYVGIADPELLTLNINGLTSLQRLEINYGQLTALDLSQFQELNRLDMWGMNDLSSLIFGSKPNLQTIYITSDSLTDIDLSQCPVLDVVNLTLDVSEHDVFVNLKNGDPTYALNNSAVYLNNGGTTNYKAYLCIDEGEAEDLSYLDDNVVLSTYCFFTPGGSYNTITGNILFDTDGIGCDENDEIQPFMKVNIYDNMTSGTSFCSYTGTFNFYTQSGAFTLTPQFENDWFITTPASATVTFADNNNNTQTQNFCITANGVHPDVEVVIIPVGAAQPGFDAMYQIVYRNKGNQALSGDITFTYDDSVLDYVSAAPTESSSSTGSLVWNYTNLLPFESREIMVTLNLNGPMETPALEIGDQLDFGAAITPLSGDETPEDNGLGFKQIITGSFDPNDIICLEGATAAPDRIGDYLHYNINFENTGNAAATFIVVKDIINEEQFDINTLQLLYASHDIEVRVQDNKVEFFFDDIQLGPLEKGNVLFKIKTKNTLQANDDVTQQAEIFFDYNWPIETNEATTVFQVLSTGDFAVDNSVKIYPNPADDFVNITAETNINSLQLYDVQGRLLQAVSSETNTAKLDISTRAQGMYFVKIMTESGVKVEKIVKK